MLTLMLLPRAHRRRGRLARLPRAWGSTASSSGAYAITPLTLPETTAPTVGAFL